ncbi:hydroxymethylglutaryl-CoA synthase family protein [Aureitalea sp. L0-47]|uniref:hydroxymethylglutaryl-CoA synthase family protein n=1 Tax=Aureitalea sp. L0-47 TaxID=2816962 RepID=UPI00223729CB|nr:hydroxymethylglutaryl-CoA synthase [Aureitalea sp. L0-47]MCW5518310.1 hydroxymethylglutaryl-CoA synthase family protein [Aureitalea sp. L0-47]
MSKVGIDALSFYVPSLFVPMEELAARRDIPYEKLRRGLGLEKMAIPDINEDAASFAANALLRLIEDNTIDPRDIGRVYLGTESAVDGSKPTATYALGVVEEKLTGKWGERAFRNCDVVDLTFACVGAVDAMHNCIDWVKAGNDRKAIVIASDLSKYELNSTGEYTQGAGAVAVLISENPSILSFSDTWGVGTSSVGDFFKPRRYFNKTDLAVSLLKESGVELSEEQIDTIVTQAPSEFWNDGNALVEVFKEEPVFEGQYSNQCYSDRITEALEHFNQQTPTNFLKDWEYLVFHLPYAYHGRRIIFSNWLTWLEENDQMDVLLAETGPVGDDRKTWERAASKSEMYRQFVKDKIEKGERASSLIGNMYTASIFMAFLSLVRSCFIEEEELSGKKVGFIAYGSGSKSKVFEGRIENGWKKSVSRVKLFEQLEERSVIDVELYEKIHRGIQQESVEAHSVITLKEIETEDQNTKGLRKYS